MNEIKCPHCGKVFQVDERGFADILRQVRTAEFDKEIAQREGMLQEQNAQAVKLAVAKAQQDAQAETAQRDARIAELETRLAAEKREREQAEKSSQIEHANELEAALAKKQAQIVQLQLLDAFGVAPQLGACVICGKEKGIFDYSIAAGGVVCSDHFRSVSRLHLSPKATALIRTLALLPISRLGEIQIGEDLKKESRRAIAQIYQATVDLHLPSLRFLNEVRGS